MENWKSRKIGKYRKVEKSGRFTKLGKLRNLEKWKIVSEEKFKKFRKLLKSFHENDEKLKTNNF